MTSAEKLRETYLLTGRNRTANFADHQGANFCKNPELTNRILVPGSGTSGAAGIGFTIQEYCKRFIKPLLLVTFPQEASR